MPGTNLTRDEAATRGSLLSVESYTIDLDLTVSDKVFESTTVIRFSCSEPGASTFADLNGATVHEITLNGQALDPFEVYRDQRAFTQESLTNIAKAGVFSSDRAVREYGEKIWNL